MVSYLEQWSVGLHLFMLKNARVAPWVGEGWTGRASKRQDAVFLLSRAIQLRPNLHASWSKP